MAGGSPQVTGLTSLLGGGPCDGCNIVLVSAEPVRADHLGLYGYHRNTSPALDALGTESVVFDGAFTVSGHTTEATFSTFTSLYPSQHDVNPVTPDDNGFDTEMTLLAEALQDAGYRTASVNGGANVRAGLGFDRGFDRYESWQSGEERWDDITGDLLDGADDRPFFLYLQSFATHDPYFLYSASTDSGIRIEAGPFVDLFTVNRTMREESMSAWGRINRRVHRSDTFQPEDRYRAYREEFLIPRMEESDEFRREMVAEYDGGIRYIDTALGSVMAELRAAGELDDTIVVVMAQHGEMFGERGRWTHSSLFGPVVRVPLVIRAPGLEPGRVDGPVSTLDVAPTILDLAGVPASRFREQAEGRSLLPVIRGEADGRRFLFADHYSGQSTVTDTRTRTRFYRHSDGGTRLYDLGPNWTADHIEDPNRTLHRRLSHRLEGFHDRVGTGTEHGDTWPYFG